MKMMLLGAPGAGKGSQASLLTGYYGVVHISTGDAFRMNIANKTEIGMYAKTFIDKGLLVPDEVTVGIVKERLAQSDCQNGFLLDGFPRNLKQAEALESIASLDAVINLNADFEVVIKRLAGRRSCTCGKVYHVSTYDSANCVCGKPLYVRDDDKEEAIRKRLEVYKNETAPLLDYYRQKGILYDIDGNATIDETFKEITAVLK